MEINKTNQDVITIDSSDALPIYQQIIEAVKKKIINGSLAQGDLIPSVNTLAFRFGVARNSIFKGYNALRMLGIIDSVPGKGYFVTNTRSVRNKNIFLLMSTFNPYREVFYNSFIDSIKKTATVDVYFHHHNIEVFESLIQNHASHYNTFIIMPEIHKKTKNILRQLDQQNLFILDTGLKQFSKLYPYVCQNYRDGFYQFLEASQMRLNNYKRLILLFSNNMRNYELIKGFEEFLSDYSLSGLIIRETKGFQPQVKDFCIALDDNDLVNLIVLAEKKKWQLGKHLGIVSYNEAPLKSIISRGITTFSPDYSEMGKSMASMIVDGRKDYIQNPFVVIERGSF